MRPEIRQSVLLWVGCVAGAMQEDEYRTKLTTAGFIVTRLEACRSSSCMTLMSARFARSKVEHVCRLFRGRNSRHYAGFRTIPGECIFAAFRQ
jgi:hypothetical protein